MRYESYRGDTASLTLVRRTLVLVFLLLCCMVPAPAEAQFTSGSDGSDGVYAPSGPPGTIVVFDPSQFHGTNAAAGIFNFTTITIPSGVTVRLSGTLTNGPVYWLAQGAVDIEGTIDLTGDAGLSGTNNPFIRVPAQPGAGGYVGGVGGNPTQLPLPGGGPGGGVVDTNCNADGTAGVFSGNQFLIPLTGGSGGGGANACAPNFGPGGGAGGGALLIASSNTINIGSSGIINARGGSAAAGPPYSGGGSGGAIRLVSNAITGGGGLYVTGGNSAGDSRQGGHGRIRIEAYSYSNGLGLNGNSSISSPFPLLLPTAGLPSARVVSINGVTISPNPNTFPDITINTTAAVPVIIRTHNIPPTAAINLTILDQNGVADTVISAPPIGNCDQDNFCTTTVNVVFPFGASRGLTKVTWTP